MSESCEEYCTVYRHQVIRARKHHKCCACRADIRPGDYYASVFTLFDREVTTYKRCGSCELTWQHLAKLCAKYNREEGGILYPMENLGCGKRYTEEWGDLPDDIAALPFLGADDRGQLLARGGVAP